jgi:hypothetical protein
LGIGDWGLGIGPNPQSPIPNPQSPSPFIIHLVKKIKIYKNNIYVYSQIESKYRYINANNFG